MDTPPHDAIDDELIAALARHYAALPQVEAIAVAGSRGREAVGADAASDIDLYVYTRAPVPHDARRAAIAACGGASRVDGDDSFWGEASSWIHAGSGIPVDVLFFDAAWIEDELRRVLERHEPRLGYSTCFWHTVRQSRPVFDRAGWFAALQRTAAVGYPEPLRRRIVAHNHPVLRGVISSYREQIEKAARRGDRVSVNHRIAALLASYFDCLFAANRVPHPGEKRLLEAVAARCTWQPERMAGDLRDLFALAAADGDAAALRACIDRLLDRLDAALIASGVGLPAAQISS